MTTSTNKEAPRTAVPQKNIDVFTHTLKRFLNDNVSQGVHYGSMENNLKFIIDHNGLRDILQCEYLSFKPLTISPDLKSPNVRNFDDFNLGDRIQFRIAGQEGVDTTKFSNGVESLQALLLPYQEDISTEVSTSQRESAIRKKRQNSLLFAAILIIISLLLIIDLITGGAIRNIILD